MSSFYWTAEGFFMDDLFQAANGDGPLYADKHLVVTRTETPFGLRFAGEIDISNSDAVGQVLRAIFPDGDSPHLDLSRLSFCDVSGIRALVDAAADLDDGGRLMLHGPPAQLRTVLRVTGWSELPSLVLCQCGAGHEWISAAGMAVSSPDHRGIDASGAPFEAPLNVPPAGSGEVPFDSESLLAMRGVASRFATASGLPATRAIELVTAVNEVATNSVVHGGGSGILHMWEHGGTLKCEVRDPGNHVAPLADRQRPGADARDPRGLWMANQMCDLVQIRNSGDGTVVRLHVKAA